MAAHQFPQQARAVRMQFHGNNAGVAIALGEHPCLPTRRSATIQNVCASADEKRDQLRGLILDHDPAFAECVACG